MNKIQTLKTVDIDTRIDSVGLKTVEIQSPVGPSSAGEDFVAKLREMAKAADSRGGSRMAGLIYDETSAPVSGISLTFGDLEDPVSRRLREARERIAEQKYNEALKLLEQLLSEIPGHHEACYLKAYCQMGLQQYESSLRTLVPLRRDNVTRRMQTRIDKLRGEIRGYMLGEVLKQIVMLLVAGAFDKITARLHELLILDPRAAIYYFLLSGTLLMSGRSAEAMGAATSGLAVAAADEKPMLEQIKSRIQDRLARDKMVPVRNDFKAKRYRRALGKLKGLDAEIRATPLSQTLEAFLTMCAKGSPHAPADSDPEWADELYRFLAEDELVQAMGFFQGEQFAKAENALQTLVAALPHFSFCNFLYANAAYRRIGQQAKGSLGSSPSLKQVIQDLQIARRHAEKAASDPRLPFAATLAQVIEENLNDLEKFEKNLEQKKKDLGITNKLIEDYNSIIQEAARDICSPEQFNRLKRRLETLGSQIPAASKKLLTDESKKACRDLLEAVKRSLQQMKGLEQEAEKAKMIGALFQRFNTKMEEIATCGGVGSISEALELKKYMQDLKRDAEAARWSLTSNELKKRIAEVLEAINNVLLQLSRF